MAGRGRPLLVDEDRGTDQQGAWVATLRFLLRLFNLILMVIGCAMIFYALYTYLDVKKQRSLKGFPWFIFAFGAAGVFVIITAATALIGVAHNSGFCLGLYSFLMIILLLGQAALAIAFFADDSWKKLLPHDDTGEAQKMAKFLTHKLSIIRWVGLAALVVQVLSVLLAYTLSNAQQRLLEEASDEEEEVWGRRAALPRSRKSSVLPSTSRDGEASQRTDPWSVRLRSKYGVDINNFSYDPTREREPQQSQEDVPNTSEANSSRWRGDRK